MQLTIDETERRRQIQLAYNEEHGITPQAIVKARNRIIGVDTGEEDIAAPQTSPRSGKPAAKSSRRDGQAPKVTYESEYTTRVDIAADPVIPYMTCEELRRSSPASAWRWSTQPNAWNSSRRPVCATRCSRWRNCLNKKRRPPDD